MLTTQRHLLLTFDIPEHLLQLFLSFDHEPQEQRLALTLVYQPSLTVA